MVNSTWGYPTKRGVEGDAPAADAAAKATDEAAIKENVTATRPESKSMRSTGMSDRKSFKRIRKAGGSIRGMLTGESRKERRAKKLAARAAAHGSEMAPSLPMSDSDEEETVYGVDLTDDTPAPAPIPAAAPLAAAAPPAAAALPAAAAEPPQESYPDQNLLMSQEEEEYHEEEEEEELLPAVENPHALQVVLLLMDPSSRRFELLQLEFDSTKAIVGDVLEQVPTSVTEATLRDQNYAGVCDRRGVEMMDTMSLSEFCQGSDVVLAIPEGTDSKECARLARPILSDPNVINMLRSNGIDCSEDVETPESTPRAAPPPHDSKKPTAAGFNITRFLSIVLLGMLAVAAKIGHDLITSPVAPGDAMAPGMWRSKCGLLSFLPSQGTWDKMALPEFASEITSKLSCDNADLEMSRDGVLTLYGPQSSVIWRMNGHVCDHDHPSCVDGLVVKPNGNLEIGGKEIHTVTTYGKTVDLSPWPFVDAPKLRVIKGRK